MHISRFTLTGLAVFSACLAVGVAPAGATFLPATPPVFGSPGSEGGQLSGPTALATNDSTHDLYVADPGNARVDQFSDEGVFVRAWGWNVVAGGPGLVQSGLSNEQQRVSVTATGGTFAPAFEGEPSIPLPFDASAAEVQAALVAIPSIGAGNVTVTGATGGPWSVEFKAAKAELNVSELTAEPTTLSGPEPSVTVATTLQGGGAFEVCEATEDVCQAGLASTGDGQLNNPVGIAVDNDATSPSFGDVYVADAGNQKVEVFSATGAWLSNIDGAGAPQGVFQGLNGVATDGQGDVWTIDSTTKNVDQFNAAGAYVVGSEFNDGYSSTKAIAVNAAASRLYLMNGVGLDEGATEAWNPADPAAGPTPIDNGGSAFATNKVFAEYQGMSLAVDPASGDLYVEDVGNSPSFSFFATVIRYDLSGKALEHFGGESVIAAAPPFAEPPEPQGLAFDPTAELPGTAPGALYTVENPTGDVRIFAPPPFVPPTVDSPSATIVNATSAELQAQVNPNYFDTHARFEYVTEAQFDASGFAGAASSAAADLGSSGGVAGEQTAFGQIQGLSEATTYHYRAVATSEVNGKTDTSPGPEQTFTTPSSPPAPIAPAVSNPPVEAAGTGVTPTAPLAFPNLTALKPLPGPKETAGKPKAKTKAKTCKRGRARKRGKCVRKPNARRASKGGQR